MDGDLNGLKSLPNTGFNFFHCASVSEYKGAVRQTGIRMGLLDTTFVQKIFHTARLKLVLSDSGNKKELDVNDHKGFSFIILKLNRS